MKTFDFVTGAIDFAVSSIKFTTEAIEIATSSIDSKAGAFEIVVSSIKIATGAFEFVASSIEFTAGAFEIGVSSIKIATGAFELVASLIEFAAGALEFAAVLFGFAKGLCMFPPVGPAVSARAADIEPIFPGFSGYLNPPLFICAARGICGSFSRNRNEGVTVMKKIVLFGALVCAMSVHARIGETQTQMSMRYGMPEEDRGKTNATATLNLNCTKTYLTQGWRLKTEFVNGRAVEIYYFPPHGSVPQPNEIQSILSAEANGGRWTKVNEFLWSNSNGTVARLESGWMSIKGAEKLRAEDAARNAKRVNPTPQF